MSTNKGTGEYDLVLSVTQTTLNDQLTNMWARRGKLAFPKIWNNKTLNMDADDDPEFEIHLEVPTLEVMGQGEVKITFVFGEGSKLMEYSVNRKTKQVTTTEISIASYQFSMRTDMAKIKFEDSHSDLLSDEEKKQLNSFQENKFTIQSLFMDFTNVKAGTFEGQQSSKFSFVNTCNSIIVALTNKLKGPDYSARPFLFGVVATKTLVDKSAWAPANCRFSTSLQRSVPKQSTLNFLMTTDPKTDISKLPEFYPVVIDADEQTIKGRLLLNHKLLDKKIEQALLQSIQHIPKSYEAKYQGNRKVECKLSSDNGDEGGTLSASWELSGSELIIKFHSQRTLPIWGELSALVGKLRLYGDQTMKYELKMSDDKGMEVAEKEIGPLVKTDDDNFWKKLARGIELVWTAITVQIEAFQSALRSLDGSYKLETMLENVLGEKGFEYILLPGADVFKFKNPVFLDKLIDLQVDATYRD
ncbi:hypothetical protein K493DRAFT_409048 [Basidiobolus meristosporus CBS 931.73]|uniref:Uncharacterized protein n=1 Tax=Basidiobolus meristosporus CBS 931.73 TaxID=1314790 RepID=A0A1Y1Y1R4_9FUNG|nr:hypothetical protein K493DRAFT_409048 [Basidiobolus meristosporus CBS 931.73]|eukprot:ORX91947.1 hypothetical protein K493DRAFT_409048 [Basidiobolus meristosporus CBS 931.73]